MAGGAPPAAYDGPYWRAEWWARVPVAKRRGALRHTDEGERFDDFAIARSGGRRRLPDDKVVRGELARSTQGGGDRACRGRRWRRLFWDTIDQVRADLAGLPRK